MSSMSRVRILVAEDEDAVARGIRDQLVGMGYECVDIVPDGRDAVVYCRSHSPDIILMDIEMPGLDGLSAVRRIRQESDVPVIILTAHCDEDYLNEAVETQVHYLLKPVPSFGLKAAVETALALARKAREMQDALQEGRLLWRAKGLLMDLLGVSEREAHRRLQRLSMESQTSMAELAEQLLRLEPLLTPEPPPPPSTPRGRSRGRGDSTRSPRAAEASPGGPPP